MIARFLYLVFIFVNHYNNSHLSLGFINVVENKVIKHWAIRGKPQVKTVRTTLYVKR